MIMKKFWVTAVLAALLIAIVASCGDDNPVESNAPEDYIVYFAEVDNPGWCYTYHPVANTLDSFALPFETRGGMTVSADGRRLYIGREQSIAVFNTRTHNVIGELPFAGGVAVSVDNQYLAITGDRVRILRTDDYEVIYEDSAAAGSGAFSRNSRHFYYTHTRLYPPATAVICVDLGTRRADVKTVSNVERYSNILPSPDESLWYLWVDNPCGTHFEAYSPVQELAIFEQFFILGNGSIMVDPDGTRVFCSNPGPWIVPAICMWGEQSILYIYSPIQNSMTSISTKGLVDQWPYDVYLPIGPMAMTPDHKWLVLGTDTPYILRLDLQTMTIEQYLHTGRDRRMYGFTCQSGRGESRMGGRDICPDFY